MPGHPCPCCGYLTLLEPGAYEICDVCFWEDDSFQRDNPDDAGGANKVSLSEAQANYRSYGVSEWRFKRNVRPPRRDEQP